MYSGSAFIAQSFLVFYCMTIAQFIYLAMTKSAARKIFFPHLCGTSSGSIWILVSAGF